MSISTRESADDVSMIHILGHCLLVPPPISAIPGKGILVLLFSSSKGIEAAKFRILSHVSPLVSTFPTYVKSYLL